jgi:hypothetical protein
MRFDFEAMSVQSVVLVTEASVLLPAALRAGVDAAFADAPAEASDIHPRRIRGGFSAIRSLVWRQRTSGHASGATRRPISRSRRNAGSGHRRLSGASPRSATSISKPGTLRRPTIGTSATS